MTPASRIEQVPRSRTEEALGALLGAGPSASARFARQAAEARIRLDLAWAAVDSAGRYRLAVLAVPTPGRAAMLLATHPRDSGEVALLGQIIAEACEGVRLVADIAQALVEPHRASDIAAFESGGLTRIATLDYLERALPRAGVLERPAPPPGWTIEPVAGPEALGADGPSGMPRAAWDELVSALDASYIETQDCPGLAGLRATDDVLVGHFGTGARPRFWLVAREHGAAHGACLVNVSQDATSSELVYLGLDRHSRGKGVARALLLQGMHLASAARCGSITLAVDARNAAARRLYDALGFRCTGARVALVRGIRGNPAKMDFGASERC